MSIRCACGSERVQWETDVERQKHYVKCRDCGGAAVYEMRAGHMVERIIVPSKGVKIQEDRA